MRSLNVVLFLMSVLSVGAQVRPEPQISGPYTHDNLAVFLIRANGDNSGQVHPHTAFKNGARASIAHYLTLQQAMEQKKVGVYETKQVNEPRSGKRVNRTGVHPRRRCRQRWSAGSHDLQRFRSTA